MATVVIYHHVSDRPHPLVDQLGIRTEPGVFLDHMRYFARNFDLVGVGDLISGKLPRRALLVTFDDAYRSVLDVAGPILRSFSAPAVFFLNPSSVLGQTLPIDNLLSAAVSRLGLRPTLARLGMRDCRVASTVDLLADRVSAMNPLQARTLKDQLLSILGATIAELCASNLFMTPEGVRQLSQYQIEVGNHSMSHSFLRSLSGSELEAEIAGSRVLLEQMAGRPVTSLSIPYGNEADATASALEIARHSGHRAIFLVHDRSNRFRTRRDVFYRTNPRSTPQALLPWRIRAVPVLRSISKWIM